MRRSRYYESSEKEICSPFAKSKRKKPVFPRTSRASNYPRTGLSKLALLLFRCTGHDDMWDADYFGRTEYATEYFVKARRAGG